MDGLINEKSHLYIENKSLGRRSELPLLREYLNQNDGFSYEFTTNYQSVMDSSLFAVGAVAGVRAFLNN